MNALRFKFMIFAAWLVFFFNIERVSEPINIASFVYVITGLLALVTLGIARLKGLSSLWPILIAIVFFISLKIVFKHPILGSGIPITVTELGAITLTGVLAHQLARSLHEFESAVANITIGRIGKESTPFSSGQAEMYREVKRAREHDRPLTMVAMKVKESSMQVAMHRMVEEAQRTMMKRYVQAGIARILSEELQDYDIVAQQDDWFILLLPETPPEEHARLAARLHQVIAENMRVDVEIGATTFPDEAVTFESLINLAMHKAEDKLSAQPQSSLGQQQPALR
jgi:hypothetical protein